MDSVLQKQDERERHVEETRTQEDGSTQAGGNRKRSSSRNKDKAERKSKEEKRKARVVESSSAIPPAATPPAATPAMMMGEKEPPAQAAAAASCTRSYSGAVPPPISSATPPLSSGGALLPDLNQAIRILEECKWRVILEHSPEGDVVAIAAFAPGPGGECSTPNTPMTPYNYNHSHNNGGMVSAGNVDHALDVFRGRTPRSAGGYQQHATPPLDGSLHGGGGGAAANIWVNANAYDGHSRVNSAPSSRVAWAASNNDDGSFTSPLPHGRHGGPLPLRRGAPAALFTMLRTFGLREFALHARCTLCDMLALCSSAVFMVLLVCQIGLLLVHWMDVLPWHLAIAAFASLFASWLCMIVFLQHGHLYRVLSASYASIGRRGQQQGGVMSTLQQQQQQLPPSARQAAMELLDTSSIDGPTLPGGAYPPLRQPPEALIAPPVAMTAPFLAAMRRTVRRCTWAIALTTALLSAFEWYWLIMVRPHATASGAGILNGSDGALWLLGVSIGTKLAGGQYILWGLISLASALALAGALWAPLCCVACLLDAHVHLAGQLRAQGLPLTPAASWEAMAFASVVRSHLELAKQTSAMLSQHTSAFVLTFGYVAISGLLETVLHGVQVGVVLVTLGALAAICVMLATLGGGNERHRSHLRAGGREALMRVHADGEYVSTTAVAAYEAFTDELNTTDGFGVLGAPHVTSRAVQLVGLGAAAALAIALQVGVDQA